MGAGELMYIQWTSELHRRHQQGAIGLLVDLVLTQALGGELVVRRNLKSEVTVGTAKYT